MAANAYGVDVRAINTWLRENLPFWAKVHSHRGIQVTLTAGDTPGADFRPHIDKIAAAFGCRAEVWGQECWAALTFPIPKRGHE
jgi:hypothetical protein